MKKRVLIVPTEVLDGLKMKLLDELTDETFKQVKDKADMLRTIREAAKTAEVDWTE